MRSVLVVDDEFGITDALRDLLSDEGFNVIVARNGREGLQRVQESPPDVILLDFMMPVMDGRTMFKALRANPDTAGIPVLMMSAISRSSIPADCTPEGFLQKPFELDDLLGAIARLLK